MDTNDWNKRLALYESALLAEARHSKAPTDEHRAEAETTLGLLVRAGGVLSLPVAALLAAELRVYDALARDGAACGCWRCELPARVAGVA